jgi:GT2 family glycosyltransferase
MSRNAAYSAGDLQTLAPRAELPLTVCALFYGNWPFLCRRFLDSLYRWTDPAAFQLRAGMNAVCAETRQLLMAAQQRFGNITFYESKRNLYKCRMMRRMLHAPPLDTEWMVWFDDDSHVTSPRWILDLLMQMERCPEAELFGSLHFVDVCPELERSIASALWYKGVSMRQGEVSGRKTIVFPVGGFWAVRSERLLQINWPDRRLQHFEDDYLMGEALRQQGVRMADFKSGVAISDAPRRAPADAPYGLLPEVDN